MKPKKHIVVGLALVALVVVSVQLALAQVQEPDHGAAGSHHDPIAPVLVALIVILASAKAGGELFERIKQPAVLGELLVGVLLGNLLLVNADWDFFEPLRASPISADWAIVVDSLSRVGVILLLFEVGLESSLGEMRRVGVSSSLVAVVGVVAPFALGYAVSWLFIKDVPQLLLDLNPDFDVSNIHLFIGATLCATSVGITARVFKDMDKLQTREARIVLGAALIDDVLGLLILAVVAAIVIAAETGEPMEVGSVLSIASLAIGFLVGAIVLGLTVVPGLMKRLAFLRTRGVMLIASLVFCFLLAYLANLVGLATIIGAFAAGLVLEKVEFSGFREEKSLHDLLTPITTFLVPIFFVVIGIQVRLETFLRTDVVGLAAGLTAAAFVGKQVCGLAVVEKSINRLALGIGMVPRGEVGLIFASIGRSIGVIDDAIFSAVVIMVIVTTLVTPPLLKLALSRPRHPRAAG